MHRTSTFSYNTIIPYSTHTRHNVSAYTQWSFRVNLICPAISGLLPNRLSW